MMSWRSAFLFFNSGWGTAQYLFKSNSSVNVPPAALGIDFQSAEYGPPIQIVYGQNKITGNVIAYDDFSSTPTTSPGKGGGGQPTGYTYTASFLLALCEGTISSIVSAYDGTTNYTPGNGPLDGNFFASGTTGQAPWSHFTGAAALGYSKTALYGYANYPLGGSPSLPNLNFEIAGLKQYGGGIVDANPADVLNDICTDPNHGINFNLVGDLTQYSDYCVANGIFMSPIYNQRGTAQQALTDLLTYTNTEAFFSENQLKVVPRGDTSVTGNGVTFTPVQTIQYQLDYDDFIVSNKGDIPVTVDRKAPSECRNIVHLSFNERNYAYNSSTVIASIDYDVLTYGDRVDDDQTYSGITTAAVAKIVAQNILQLDFYVRNTYKFQLPWRYCRLEPMDLLELTDPNIGLNNTPVRILSVEEDEAGLLSITAEEYPEGVGYAVMFPTEPNVGTNQDMTVDPGPVQAPYIVRGPGLLVSNSEPEIWIAVTGTNPAWGGCTAYLSYDGVSYQPVNQIARQAIYGIIALPVWAATNVQTVGQLIQDGAGNTMRVATVTGDFKTGGSAPTWTTTLGGATTDNHVTWVCVAVAFAVPGVAALTDTAGGALVATTYYVECTWVDQYGRETPAGTEASHVTAASRQLNVAQPSSPPAGATGWNIYAANTLGGGSGHEQLQTALPIATTSWVEPTSGLIAGAVPPTANTTGLFCLPSGSDPDQINIPRVYLYRGTLAGGTQTDADSFATLSMLDTELLSYETATLASDGGYDLSYIRRGGYNSANVAHISGAPFIRLDGNIIRVPVDPSQIGSTVHLKFLSVNVFNRTPRTLAEETAYSYVVGTNQEIPDVPTSVSTLTAAASADIVNLSWTNPSDLAVGATSVEYAPTWAPFNLYALGAILYDHVTNTTQQVSAITTGISGAFPVPTFSGTVGGTVVDAGVTWKCLALGPLVATNLPTPPPPFLFYTATGGPSGTIFVKITWVDAYGLESLPSAEATLVVPSLSQLVVALAGPPPSGAVAWNIYATGVGSGSEKLLTHYNLIPITTPQVTISDYTNTGAAPPSIVTSNQGGFAVLHTVMGAANHYKHQQAGDQEYVYRIRQRGWLAQAGWGPYSGVVSAAHANSVRKNSALGSANMLLDPNLLRTRYSGDFTFWTYDNADYTVNMTGSADGTPAFQVSASASSTNRIYANEYVPAKQNDSIYARCRAIVSTLSAGSLVMGAAWYDESYTLLSSTEAITPVAALTSIWRTFGQFFQPPTGCYYARFYLRGTSGMVGSCLVDNMFFSIQDYATGSTPTTICNTTMSYSSTTTSVTVSWSGFVIKLPDNTNQGVANGNTGSNTGLTSSHIYYTYLSFDIARQGGNDGVIFQTGGAGGGTAAGMCYNAVSAVAVNAQNNLNQVPMSTGAFQVATPSSGTGSGSGGGSAGGTGGCLYEHDLVQTEGTDGCKGKKAAGLLRDGDKVWTPRGWRPISGVRHESDSDFVTITLSNGQKLTRSAQHRLIDAGNQEIMVGDVKLGQLLKSEWGRVRVTGMELVEGVAARVSFSVQRQIFYAMVGGVTEHNANGKP